jgi:ElaB/YqjD/DUF883 family membrane-anchored ribosome-binding protein
MDSTYLQPLDQDAPNLADKVADRANGAIRSTQTVANAAFERLADDVEGVRNRAAPLVDRLSGQATAAARCGVDAMRSARSQLRAQAIRASDGAAVRIRDEPFKAVLIAAATGVALMALVALLSRTRSPG